MVTKLAEPLFRLLYLTFALYFNIVSLSNNERAQYMDITELVKMLSETCVTIVVIGYFLFKDFKTTMLINESLTRLNETTELIKELLLKER